MHGRRAAVVVVSALALVAGCAGSGSDATTVRADTGPSSPRREVPHDLAARAVDAGLTVVADEAVVPSELSYTRWQVEAMETAARGGQGLTGSQLDAAFPVPAGAPPLSYFLGAWISRGGSAAARLAAEVVGDHDWTRSPEFTFPEIVLALFVDEALAPPATSGSGTAWTPDVPVDAVLASWAGPVDAPCSAVSEFLDSTLSSIFDAVKLAPDAAGTDGVLADVGNFFAGLYNLAVDLARTVVAGLIETVTAPVLKVLGDVLAGIAVVTQVASYLKGWDTSIRTDRSAYRTGVAPGRGEAGKATMTAKGLAEQWPPALKDCARKFGVEEPKGMAEGSKVTWKVLVDGERHVVFDQPATTTVDATREANYGFEAEAQPAKLAASKRRSSALFALSGSADSEALTQLRALAKDLVSRLAASVLAPIDLPGVRDAVASVVNSLLAPVFALIEDTDAADALLGLSASTEAFVDFAVEDDSTTTTTEPESRDGCGTDLAEISAVMPQLADSGPWRESTLNEPGRPGIGGVCTFISEPLATVMVQSYWGEYGARQFAKAQANGGYSPLAGLRGTALVKPDEYGGSIAVLDRDHYVLVMVALGHRADTPAFVTPARELAKRVLG